MNDRPTDLANVIQRLWVSSLAYGQIATRSFVRAIWLILRVIAVPLTLGVSAVAAFILVKYLYSTLGQPWVENSANYLGLGVAAFGGTMVLATFRDLAKSIPDYWAFVKQPSFMALAKPSVLTFIAFAGLSMSMFAVTAEVSQDNLAVAEVSQDNPRLFNCGSLGVDCPTILPPMVRYSDFISCSPRKRT